MKAFVNKVAVITGAASGIGLALANRCAQEGMKVVLADIEESALSQTAQAFQSKGVTFFACHTDVSKASDMEALAQKTLEIFGRVDLLFNNAGVGVGTTIWESTLADWQWVMGVNLWGVIHGLRIFVPMMLAQDSVCHIVNTASIAGLLPYHPSAAYHVTKHAVVALSENLFTSLAQRSSKVKVSVLCPGWVKTKILDSERNRPVALQNDPHQPPPSGSEAILEDFRQAVNAGMPPEQLAEITFEAIRKEQFYILPHPEFNPVISRRMEDILLQRNPS